MRREWTMASDVRTGCQKARALRTASPVGAVKAAMTVLTFAVLAAALAVVVRFAQ